MVDVCPTVTAIDIHQYAQQLSRIVPFAHRVHIDLMDGVFAPTHSPSLSEISLPKGVLVDLHLMYSDPTVYTHQVVRLHPHTAIIHAESQGDLVGMVHELHAAKISVGIALLSGTPVEAVHSLIEIADHVLVFSGKLGFHGGVADLTLLDKVAQVRSINSHIEIAWDGGINDQNARELVGGGVEVLNVGGYVQNATDPQAAYAKIQELIQQ